MYYSYTYESPLGTLTLAKSEQGLCGLWLEGQKYHGAALTEALQPTDDPTLFSDVVAWLDEYFAGNQPDPRELSLAPEGSAFRQAVWKQLLQIPYGQTTTYGAIAQALKESGGTSSALAVGGAVGHNPISIIIPCHRVVGAQGSLTGYAGGLARKQWLLDHEGLDLEQFSIPTSGTAL